MRARLSRLAETPAALLAPVAVAGFEAGFPRVCEPYGTGLYFPPAAVREIHAALARSRKPLISLGLKGDRPRARRDRADHRRRPRGLPLGRSARFRAPGGR